MPLTPRNELETNHKFGVRPEASLNAEDDTAQFSEVLGAAFRTENTIGSFFSNESKQSETDEDFDPFADIEGYEIHARNFVDANNNDDVQSIKNQIDREGSDRKLIQDAGATGVAATLAAGVLDPVNLIPVGGTAIKGYRLGGSILRGAATTARAGLIGATVAETALHASQETRTLGESAVNVAGATLLSGVLGGAVSTIKGSSFRSSTKKLEDDLIIPKPDEPDFAEPNSIVIDQGSIGAAATRDTTLEEETLIGAVGVEKAAAAIRLNPKIRLATSPSVESRRFIQEIAETPFYYNKNEAGIANPVALESIVDLQNAKIGKAIEFQKDIFKNFKNRIKKEGGDKLDYLHFKDEVGKATRRLDKHPIKEVQELAEIYRREVIDPMKEAAISAKLLPEDVKPRTADSYLHRWWDKNKIRAKRPELEQIIHNGLRDLPEIKSKEGNILDDDELALIAEEVVDKLLGHSDIRIPYDLPLTSRGPLKERTLNFIKDIDVEDYLINDIEAVSRKYVRTLAPDIAIKDWFGELNILGKDGFVTNSIREDYSKLRQTAKSEKELTKLDKRMKADIEDITAVVNQVRGTYGVPNNPDSTIVRVARGVREVQFITKLGGMTVSAFPDIARPVMVHGFTRTMRDGVIPMIRAFKTFRLAGRELKEAGAGWEMTLDSRAMTIAEIENPYVSGNRFEKGLHSISNTFGKITLMTQWNATLKEFAGVITQARIIDVSNEIVAGTAKKKDIRYLAQIGINAQTAKEISDQLGKHGETYKGVKLANTTEWTNPTAQLIYRAALKKETDRVIVTPGAGDLPLILKGTEAGKMVGQFRSFSLASTNKVLISGLQEADAQTMIGWQLAIGMGMVAYAFKTWDRGKELSDDPKVWIAEGIDRSGILGILGEINQISNKFTRGSFSLQGLAGAPPLTRYASANSFGVLAGPTVGTTQDAIQLIGASTNGEWTPSDSRALRRLIPYQNLVGARQLFDKMEDGINESLGVR